MLLLSVPSHYRKSFKLNPTRFGDDLCNDDNTNLFIQCMYTIQTYTRNFEIPPSIMQQLHCCYVVQYDTNDQLNGYVAHY